MYMNAYKRMRMKLFETFLFIYTLLNCLHQFIVLMLSIYIYIYMCVCVCVCVFFHFFFLTHPFLFLVAASKVIPYSEYF